MLKITLVQDPDSLGPGMVTHRPLFVIGSSY